MRRPRSLSSLQAIRPAVRRHLFRFAREEDGVMIALVIFLLLILLTVGGVGVDVMRQEMNRARLQDVLDRAILAAADLDQTYAPKDVVEDYFEKSGMKDFLTNVSVDQGSTYRIVNATASTQMKTQFLGKIGFPTFTVNAYGQAEESIGDAEVALVLDISGSMGSNQRLQRMQTAAKDFVDTVILDESLDAVSLSVVPYTSQVNAGAKIMDRMNVLRKHAFSNCIIFTDEDYDRTDIGTTRFYEQGEHFELTGHLNGTITNPSCPMRSYEEIAAFSNNRQQLKQQISQFNSRANTSIHIGMKWATGMLDPSFRPVVTSLVSSGDVPEAFLGRPTAWTSGALKTIILMTDGENFTTYGIRPQAYGTPSQRYHWHQHSLIDWVQANVDQSLWNDFYFVRSTPANSDSLLDKICTRAKEAGILVWTVGFETSNHGASVMAKCASSPSHFFRVEGVEISEAFKSIARQLNKLKLTQ
ncbi:hypothetical protein ATO6_19145 [Oceanicola sp. 22II-s10i]|uniref:Tad domain-containing protein n=1 Tax=Oceanicola sp. 22II-s10i TaxID=1317116 RepID=UPI000B522502|nr:Tad domain-containing protein [Oceanicola sp. 22II-s10i]OWU83260.1 hypothetical protein ATO6_19145 [Oceanicola sp. 22II-s10i]